jgi:hypothetical protein
MRYFGATPQAYVIMLLELCYFPFISFYSCVHYFNRSVGDFFNFQHFMEMFTYGMYFIESFILPNFKFIMKFFHR